MTGHPSNRAVFRYRRLRLVAAAGAVLTLAAGCIGVTSGSAIGTVTPSGSATPSTASSGPVPGSGSAPAPQIPAPAAHGDNLARLDGQARSVSTTGWVTGLSSIHLRGTVVVAATGPVTDATGRNLGTGTLRATSTDLTVRGVGLELSGSIRVQPGVVTVSGPSIGFPSSATLDSAGLTFQPAPPNPPASAANPTVSTTVAPAVSVAGPVQLQSESLQLSGTGLTFADAPNDLSVGAAEADLSWAGSGTIAVAGQTLQSQYLGLRAQQLGASLHRSRSSVGVHGTGLALQAYRDGVPQLRVPARFDVLSTNATTGFIRVRHAFVWTPRNLDNSYDMAILSVHPLNAAAGSVHLGLLPMPPMFGGEAHALVGGDTAGLKGGDAIDSLVARHGDDKRSIGYDAPAGQTITLLIEGNFDPITVTVPTW